jgi:hypothetical protein
MECGFVSLPEYGRIISQGNVKPSVFVTGTICLFWGRNWTFACSFYATLLSASNYEGTRRKFAVFASRFYQCSGRGSVIVWLQTCWFGVRPQWARGIFYSTPFWTILVYNGYRVCLPRKRDRGVAWSPTPSCTKVLRMSRGQPLLHLCTFIACYGVTFTFNLIKVLSVCRSFRSQFVVKENVKEEKWPG